MTKNDDDGEDADDPSVDGSRSSSRSRLDESGTRRTFLKMFGAGAGAAAAVGDRLRHRRAPTSEEFFRQHYKKLTRRGQEADLRAHRGGDARAHGRRRRTSAIRRRSTASSSRTR